MVRSKVESSARRPFKPVGFGGNNASVTSIGRAARLSVRRLRRGPSRLSMEHGRKPPAERALEVGSWQSDLGYGLDARVERRACGESVDELRQTGRELFSLWFVERVTQMPVQVPGELGVAGLVGCDAPELPPRSSRRSALRLDVGDERRPGLRDTSLTGILECDLEQAARAARCEVVAYRLCPASQRFPAHDPCVPDFVPSRAPQPIRKAAADRRAPELSRQCAKTPNAPGFVGGRPGVPRAGSCSVSAGTCSTGGSRSPARVTPTFTRQRLGVRAGNVYEILALFVRGRAADAARSCLRAPARASTRDHLSAVPGRPHRVPFDRAVLLAAQGQALVALGATARDDLTNDVGALHDPVHLYLSVPITLVPAALTPDDSDPREDPIERQRERTMRSRVSHGGRG